ncbi:hypothetical protein RCL1_008048 [Eukaryota sp. TZLM3-RCL]
MCIRTSIFLHWYELVSLVLYTIIISCLFKSFIGSSDRLLIVFSILSSVLLGFSLCIIFLNLYFFVQSKPFSDPICITSIQSISDSLVLISYVHFLSLFYLTSNYCGSFDVFHLVLFSPCFLFPFSTLITSTFTKNSCPSSAHFIFDLASWLTFMILTLLVVSHAQVSACRHVSPRTVLKDWYQPVKLLDPTVPLKIDTDILNINTDFVH